MRTELRAACEARQAEWPGSERLTLSFRGLELLGEVGEAANVMKKLERERLDIAGPRSTVAALAEELADVVICSDLVGLAIGEHVETSLNRSSALGFYAGLRPDALGVMMGKTVGRVLDMVEFVERARRVGRGLSDSTGVLGHTLSEMVRVAHRIADEYEVDLPAAVRAKFNATSERNGLRTRMHVLYRTGDGDAPDVIRDRNGEVVLDMCRLCGRGESELVEMCGDRT